jgi:hypothetical protein
MMSVEKSRHTISLDDLNPQVRERVQKFDTGNDGELDINEAIQGLIALQKQSNNYKKMIWLLIPVLCFVLAGSFGTTILAINLTREFKIDSGSNSLKTMTGETVSVGIEYSTQDLFEMVWNPIEISTFEYININGSAFTVIDTHQQFEDGKCRAIIRTESVSFVLDEISGTFDVKVHPAFVNDTITQEIKSSVVNWLDENFSDALLRHTVNKIQLGMIRPSPSCPSGQYYCSSAKKCYLTSKVCPNIPGGSASGNIKAQKVVYPNVDPDFNP